MRSVPQAITDLLHLRTVARQNFGLAFRRGADAEPFREEVRLLSQRIRELEASRKASKR